MPTPRRGVRRPPTQRRAAPARPATGPRNPAAPKPATAPSAAAATPATATGQGGTVLWVRMVDWAAWIVLWASALGAGYLLGKIEIAKVVFMAVMLAITVLPWIRWIRRGSAFRLVRSRIAWLQGVLAIFVGLVLSLSGHYLLALPLVVVELAASAVVLVMSPRPAQDGIATTISGRPSPRGRR